MENNVKLIKTVAGLVVRPAVHQIVFGIIATNVPRRNVYEKVLAIYGGFVIASVVSNVAVEHIEDKVDEINTWVSEHR